MIKKWDWGTMNYTERGKKLLVLYSKSPPLTCADCSFQHRHGLNHNAFCGSKRIDIHYNKKACDATYFMQELLEAI